MATTSLWRIHGNVNKVIRYVMNPEKTEKKLFVTGLSCSTENAADDMNRVKRHFGKTDGVTAYHGYQSFAEGEVTPEQAHDMGVELAQRLWGDRYQVIITTHTDKENHLHNHFVLNTVSFVDGMKFHRTDEDYRKMMEMSDRICRENGLSVVRHSLDGKGKSHGEWNAERSGKTTIRSQIRADIDVAVKASVTEREFLKVMHDMGYEMKLYAKNGEKLLRPSLRPEGSEKFFRFDRLGEGYDFYDIDDRILARMRNIPVLSEDERDEIKRYRNDNPPHTAQKGIAALYYHFCYELRIIEKHPYAVKKVSAFMREELRKLGRLDEQVRFLAGNDIKTEDDLDRIQEELQRRSDAETEKRKKARNLLRAARTAGREEDISDLKDKVTSLTDALKNTRNELALCSEIRTRSEKITESLGEIRRQYEEPEKASVRQKERNGWFR